MATTKMSAQESEDENALLEWYRGVTSRRVDLIGDYAGNELFLVEGDSLLLKCFDDPILDFDTGFQLLHAVYAVESFLQNLIQRKSNLQIVFFDENEQLCVPEGTSEINRPKYLLARAVIRQHLKANLCHTETSVDLHTFSSVHDPKFLSYLSDAGVYFIMCHDGARTGALRSVDEVVSNEEIATSQESMKNRLRSRNMIRALLDRGYNVALINGLEWRDTKIMSEVVEGQGKTRSATENGLAVSDETKSLTDDLTAMKVQENNHVPSHKIREASASKELTCRCGKSASENVKKSSPRRNLTSLAMQELLSSDPDCENYVKAYLWHASLIESLPLYSRRIDADKGLSVAQSDQDFFAKVIVLMTSLIKDPVIIAEFDASDMDVADLLDGRLFFASISRNADKGKDGEARRIFEAYAQVLCSKTGVHLSSSSEEVKDVKDTMAAHSTIKIEETILPFSNAIFDKHLDPIRLKVKNAKPPKAESGRIFKEVTHWHNAKRRLIIKTAAPLSGRDKMKIARRNDNFMAEMQTYAASLTNATGKSLEPEIVTLGGTGKVNEIKDNSAGNKAPKVAAKGKGAKKQAMLEEIAANKAVKDSDNADKIFAAWKTVRRNLDAEKSIVSKYHKMMAYLRDLAEPKRRIVGAEVQLHLVCILFDIYRATSNVKLTKETGQLSAEALGVRALLWDTVRKLPSYGGYTKTIAMKTRDVMTVLRLEDIDVPIPSEDRKLTCDPAFMTPKEEQAKTGMTSQEFELLHCGPYMDRNLDSAPDKRVPFEPDGWQRQVLDELDAENSLFVVAPTSSGKTFISFYAMEKVLRSNDDSILVYVAPTKALVNQIAAEVQARFRKSYKHGGKSVWAIHTRDYRINNPTGCQVLVTVPHILQIMLLAPNHAKTWSTKVKYIIFDEVHSIGQAEDGVVWEQLLLLAPCPIIALSATVGNPEAFSSWLSETQRESGHKLTMIQHTHRYSDLRKFIYHAPTKFAFRGLADRPAFGTLGLDGLANLAYMHPVASLVNRSRGIPSDLSLEARDCLLLFNAMSKYQNAQYPIDDSLGPIKALPKGVIKKKDVILWEKALKDILKMWLADEKSPFEKVLNDLSKSMNADERHEHFVTKGDSISTDLDDVDIDDLCETTLPLLCKLHERNALPAIFFNYERNKCERICAAVTGKLDRAESEWKESNPAWKAKLQGFEQYKKDKMKSANKKVPKQATKKKGQDDDDPKNDKLLEATIDDVDPYALFDPEDPIDGYHFAARHKASAEELAKYYGQLRWRGISEELISGLKRGIGVHHAGMNRKYRQVVEILFRKGFLRVVIATGTLALGINMPCATVVFTGDSVFLTALNFRQAAGRAGRRGFDLLGNVVFQGVSRAKVCRLLSSRLPDLNGHFPVTTSLILRLFTLLSDSDNSPYAISAINSLLSQPRLYLDGPAFRDQVLHHLRFSIEYLRRQDLLSAGGAPINFAGLTSHLYFTENSSFALNALVKSGYFHDLCSNINTNQSEVLRTLMRVMAHLFGRRPCRQVDAEYLHKVKQSTSVVFLPPMPPKAVEILQEHNKETLQIFTTYVETFVDQHMESSEHELPFTHVPIGGSDDQTPLRGTLPPTKVRSAFVALSGHGDKFASISDLCSTVRHGVFLEQAVIPHMELYPEETKTPLNAYLYDFFMHGDIDTIEKANGVRKADIWFLLNDFSLVLATINASLANFLKLPESDLSLEDLAGEGDEQENLEDDKFADDSTVTSQGTSTTAASFETGRTSISSASSRSAAPKSKKKVEDSWDDAMNEDDDEATLDGDTNGSSTEVDQSKEELERGFLNIHKAFVKLRTEFDGKFRKIFA